MKALVAGSNKEKALVYSRGLLRDYNFKLREGSFEALELSMKMLGERAGVGEAR